MWATLAGLSLCLNEGERGAPVGSARPCLADRRPRRLVGQRIESTVSDASGHGWPGALLAGCEARVRRGGLVLGTGRAARLRGGDAPCVGRGGIAVTRRWAEFSRASRNTGGALRCREIREAGVALRSRCRAILERLAWVWGPPVDIRDRRCGLEVNAFGVGDGWWGFGGTLLGGIEEGWQSLRVSPSRAG